MDENRTTLNQMLVRGTITLHACILGAALFTEGLREAGSTFGDLSMGAGAIAVVIGLLIVLDTVAQVLSEGVEPWDATGSLPETGLPTIHLDDFKLLAMLVSGCLCFFILGVAVYSKGYSVWSALMFVWVPIDFMALIVANNSLRVRR